MTKINGTMVTASHPGHSITWNISFYKKIQLQPGKEEWQDSDNMGGDLSDNVADEINQDGDNEVQGRRYPQRDRQPTQRYGQNIYE
jgi:glutamate mutase epsilon subunit